MQTFGEERLERAKMGFALRHVPRSAMGTLIGGMVRPRSGDVVLAVVSRLGQHRRIEQPSGRRAALHVGDEVLVAYADRYAPDQYEAEVPNDLRKTQLVASGGIASAALSRSLDVRNATDLLPVGLVGDDQGRPLNVADFAMKPVRPQRDRPLTVAVIGTSMNSGKTTIIHFLVRGLSRAGVRAGVTKVTGTGSGNDYWVMIDAGAHLMLDFTDVGLASTYRQPMQQVERTFVELLDHLTASGTDVNFVEIADGIYQRETSRLIEAEVFRSSVDVVIFAAADAMGAAAGVAHLRGLGLKVAAVSGRITRSPLATREAERVLGLPVLGIPELVDPVAASAVIGLPPELLDKQALDAATPWPSVQPEWEADGPFSDHAAILTNEEAISTVGDPR
ncbi:DUF1611 domain-containing protein [Pseudonocardia aurantiaca]|uniref:DUF1611 domain-containing protein n=1 Tax=Pseudonocardia aurantiaca TaxID=75290 RepID=UPI0031D328B7